MIQPWVRESDEDRTCHFSPRQSQIVSLVAEGLGDKEIARRLGVSISTVRTHLQRLYKEMGAHNRARAVATWLQSYSDERAW